MTDSANWDILKQDGPLPLPGQEQAALSTCRLRKAIEDLQAYKPCEITRSRRAPTVQRLEESLSEQPLSNLSRFQDEVAEASTPATEKQGTVFYLAYGSNLSYSTFQGRRGIRPLAQLNVLVPELRMTFDLPGIPYTEPCFANTARRDPTVKPRPPPPPSSTSPPDYHKNHWHKGLVGVVYEVTPKDFAHIIATEGGGASYQDVLVTCYPLDPAAPGVPDAPTTAPFKAHTLFAPYVPPNKRRGGRAGRPDPAYAQASARYLGLISGGAREHGLPDEYQRYLDDLRPYTITTPAQRVGQFVLLSLWGPFVAMIFALTRIFQDKKTGISPPWLMWLSGQLFAAVWVSYDNVFKKYFGDGERTIGDDAGDSNGLEWALHSEVCAEEKSAHELLYV